MADPSNFLPEEIRALIALSGVGVCYVGGHDFCAQSEWHIMFGPGVNFIETHIPAESSVEEWRAAIGSTIDKWNEVKNEQNVSRV